jgi:hypothetical protein
MDPNEPPEPCFRRALAVAEGAALEVDRAAVRKMVTIVAGPTGADSEIGPAGFSVLWPFRRDAFRYWPSLGPHVVGILRALAPGGSLAAPFRVEAPALSRVAIRRETEARWFWVSSSKERIVIACRIAVDSGPPPTSPSALPPWTAAAKVFARFRIPRPCEHCREPSTRYRLLDSVLICQRCGRSGALLPDEADAFMLDHEGLT